MNMFYRFNAHKATKPQATDTSADRLAKKFAGSIRLVQRHWAGFMDRQTSRIPVKRLKAIFLVFVFGSACYCIYLVQDGVFSHTSLRFETNDLGRLWPFDPHVQKEKAQKQSAFSRYLDSLEMEVKRDSLQSPQYYQP